MERGNTQQRRGDSERGRRGINYESRNRQDNRGYGARSFNGESEDEHYIDQDSLRRRGLSGEGNSTRNPRADVERSSTGYVQGRHGDWSQFEEQEVDPYSAGKDYSRNRSSFGNSRYGTELTRQESARQPGQFDFVGTGSHTAEYPSRQTENRGTQPLDRSGPYSGRGPKGYKRSDERIIEEACLRLEKAGDVDASEIEVTCSEGVITLRGKVEDRASKRIAEQCVEDIYGVRDVMNELQVSKGLFTNLFDSSDGNVARDELLGKL